MDSVFLACVYVSVKLRYKRKKEYINSNFVYGGVSYEFSNKFLLQVTQQGCIEISF